MFWVNIAMTYARGKGLTSPKSDSNDLSVVSKSWGLFSRGVFAHIVQ